MAENILEIIQIDEEYSQIIKNNILNILEVFNKRKFPFINLILSSNTVDYISKLLYFTFSLINTKTIGEESMNIHQKHKSFLFTLLKSISNKHFAYLIMSIYSKKLEKYIMENLLSRFSDTFKRNIQNFVLSSINEDSLVKFIDDLNLVFIFLYQYSSFIDIFFKNEYKNNTSSLSNLFYKSVAAMIIITKLISLIEKAVLIRKIIKMENVTKVESKKNNELHLKIRYYHKHSKESNENKLESHYTCLLCLEKIRLTKLTTTKCGHLFCWDCISSYLQENPKCPKCRKEVYYNQIILIT